MTLLATILAVLCGVAGWYYAFYSIAAQRLAGVESASINRVRVRLRRVNGCLMILLGAAMYLLINAVDQRWPRVLAFTFSAVMVLLVLVLLLTLVDLRLTRQLRDQLRAGRDKNIIS